MSRVTGSIVTVELVEVSIFDAIRERENRNREALHAVVNDWKESS
jgi:hypothetical protein